MEELFAEAFRALIGVGGAGWLVAGIELLGLIVLFREGGRVRDRFEALSERAALALERVAASNQTVAAGLASSTRSSEDLVRLVAELARRTEADSKRVLDEVLAVGQEARKVEDYTKGNSEWYRALQDGQVKIAESMYGYRIEVARLAGLPPPEAEPIKLLRRG